MDQFAELLKQINIAETFVIFVGIWVFYNRLNAKIEALDHHLSSKIEEVGRRFDNKIDKLAEK